MENCVVVIDSGMGGLSVLIELLKTTHNVNFVYFADVKNLPYGNKSKKKLLNITIKNINYILKNFNPISIIFGCNTIGTTVFEDVKKIYPKIKMFSIKPCVLHNKQILDKKTLVLATTKTIDSLQHMVLSNNIVLCKMPMLANKVEKYYPNKTNIVPYLKHKLTCFKTKKISNIVLGCTHYYFVLNEITSIFNQQKIYTGIEFLIKNIKKSLPELFDNNSLSNNKIKFIITKNFNKNITKYKKIIEDYTLIK